LEPLPLSNMIIVAETPRNQAGRLMLFALLATTPLAESRERAR